MAADLCKHVLLGSSEKIGALMQRVVLFFAGSTSDDDDRGMATFRDMCDQRLVQRHLGL